MNIKELKEIIKDLSDDCELQILFECTEAQPKGFQYQVKVLDIFPIDDEPFSNKKILLFCHEEDYPGHYSKRKK